MTSNSIRRCGCEGWWEQVYFGRRPMKRLTLSFDAGRVSGSGVDVVGRFTFEGRIDEAGGVALSSTSAATRSTTWACTTVKVPYRATGESARIEAHG